MTELTMHNGEVQDVSTDPFVGMQLRCTRCSEPTKPVRKQDDPQSVCRCDQCGKKHATDNVEVA